MRCGALLGSLGLALALGSFARGAVAQEPPPVAEPPPPPPSEPAPPVAPAAPSEPAPTPPVAPSEPAPPTPAPWPETPPPAAPPPAAPPSVAPPPVAPPPVAPPPVRAAPAAPSPSAAFPAAPEAKPVAPAASPAPSGPPGAPASAEPAKKPALPPEEPGPEPEDDSYGVLGPFRIGPVLSFGLPSLLGFGGMIKLTRYIGAGVNVGLIPEVTLKYYGEAKVSYQDYSLYGHLHPFGGGFFLGAQLGYARVRGSYATSIDLRGYSAVYPELPDRLSYTSRASVQTLVLTPEIGYFHIFGSGFAFGADGGLQIPVAPSEITFERGVVSGLPADVADRAFAPHDQKVRSTLEKVGRTLLPAFHLRVGYLL
jgi:hypothetical protein